MHGSPEVEIRFAAGSNSSLLRQLLDVVVMGIWELRDFGEVGS